MIRREGRDHGEGVLGMKVLDPEGLLEMVGAPEGAAWGNCLEGQWACLAAGKGLNSRSSAWPGGQTSEREGAGETGSLKRKVTTGNLRGDRKAFSWGCSYGFDLEGV